MLDILKKATSTGIIPVIKIEDSEIAVSLAEAIIAGGINTIEVTVRNDSAFQSIENIKKNCPGMLVGAGTIISPALADRAAEAGADYMVAPGFHRQTVLYCKELGIPIVPGCVTPTEIQSAIEEGLQILKFFPASQYGGIAGIKELAGPFPNIKFIPTNGICYENLCGYLQCKTVAAVGGSFMARADVIKRRDWDAITANCRRAVSLSRGVRPAYVGISHDSEAEGFSSSL